MKLILKREQKKGSWGGKPKFILQAQADVTSEERENIEKYQMGGTLIYTNADKLEGAGFWRNVMQGIDISISSLVGGREIECKDIVEMITMEEQIKAACENFKIILEAAAKFGGEEIIEYT